MPDSVNRVNKKYYPQILLEECKYIIKKNKMENFIFDDLDLSSSDNESDNETHNESDNETDDGSDGFNGAGDEFVEDYKCINSIMDLIVYDKNVVIHY